MEDDRAGAEEPATTPPATPPTALSVVTFGLGALLAAPLLGLTDVEGWREARDEAVAPADT